MRREGKTALHLRGLCRAGRPRARLAAPATARWGSRLNQKCCARAPQRRSPGGSPKRPSGGWESLTPHRARGRASRSRRPDQPRDRQTDVHLTRYREDPPRAHLRVQEDPVMHRFDRSMRRWRASRSGAGRLTQTALSIRLDAGCRRASPTWPGADPARPRRTAPSAVRGHHRQRRSPHRGCRQSIPPARSRAETRDWT